MTISAAAATGGLAAGDPLACVVAIATALVAVTTRRRTDPTRRPAIGSALPGDRVPELRFAALFSTFRGDEARSAGIRDTGERAPAPPVEPPPEPEDAGEDGEPAGPDETDAAYEEFAAGLEEGDAEEISFLPPYVSGGETADAEDDADGAWEPPAVDSPLLQELNDVLDPRSRMRMPRRFALGTVAILRNLLDPDDVARILEEQRRYPRLRFGDIAVELGLLTTDQRDEMVLAQQEGLFSDEEIRDAKHRLESHYARGGRHR